MPFLLLALSVALSAGRNLLSKKISALPFGSRAFFLCQGALFLCGGIALLLFGGIPRNGLSAETMGYAVPYGLLLILAQWFYTAALAEGSTALCSTVYSLGFILPTLSGAILWSEPFSIHSASGVLCAAAAVVVSGTRPQRNGKRGRSYYFVPLLIAMLSSGGLGIIQKLQQRSDGADQKVFFLLMAFLLAAGISLLFALCIRKERGAAVRPQTLALSSGIGVCFGCCNLLNTTLAGLLPSAVLFPTLNGSVILLSTLLGAVFFKERLTRREVAVLILGGAAIALLNFG